MPSKEMAIVDRGCQANNNNNNSSNNNNNDLD